MYISYERRIQDVENANFATGEMLSELRKIRTAQMSANGGDLAKELERALENYEYALREEWDLRNVNFFGLGYVWKVPNVPDGPDVAAAKQFLGIETDDNGDLIL